MNYETSSTTTFYTIVVREYFAKNNYIEWNFKRRYNDFLLFHQQLKQSFPNFMIKLPAKNIFKKFKRFLDNRRLKLQIYLQQIINTTAYSTDHAYNTFFDLSNPNRKIIVR